MAYTDEILRASLIAFIDNLDNYGTRTKCVVNPYKGETREGDERRQERMIAIDKRFTKGVEYRKTNKDHVFEVEFKDMELKDGIQCDKPFIIDITE